MPNFDDLTDPEEVVRKKAEQIKKKLKDTYDEDELGPIPEPEDDWLDETTEE